jgi:hypothetical protein
VAAVVTVSTESRADLVKLIAACLEHLVTLGDRQDDQVFYTYTTRNTRLDNCHKVRRKLMELLDESGVPK